jgi:hypothetical protein
MIGTPMESDNLRRSWAHPRGGRLGGTRFHGHAFSGVADSRCLLLVAAVAVTVAVSSGQLPGSSRAR